MRSHTSKLSTVLLLMSAPLVLSACVSQGKYNDLQAQNQQLQQQVSEQQEHVGRLQSAIKYTVNSDLLFRPGSWQMSNQGKRVISQMATKLAPTQQQKIYVNGYTENTPIGKAVQQAGGTTKQ